MKKYNRYFVIMILLSSLISGLVLYVQANDQDEVDPQLWGFNWHKIRQYILYGDSTLYNKRLDNPQLWGTATLQNYETITNGTDGQLSVVFNEDSTYLGEFIIASSVDSPNVADNDHLDLVFRASDDSGDMTDVVRLAASFTDVSDESEESELAVQVYGGGTQQTPLLVTATGVFVNGADNYAADTSAVDDDYGVLLSSISTYTEGLRICFKAGVANTGACTIQINALGVKSIKANHDQDPPDNYIEVGSMVELRYDGTDFQLISPDANP